MGFFIVAASKGYFLVAVLELLISVTSLVEQGFSGVWAQELQLPSSGAQAQ